MPTSPALSFPDYFPPNAVAYCQALWQQHRFRFVIARHRRTRLGDYQYTTTEGHRISVNSTLNPYAFTFTYLHEVAHLLTQQQWLASGEDGSRRRPRERPHGPAWKRNFQALMQPLLENETFPLPLRRALQIHMTNPTATSGADPALVVAFRRHDASYTDQKILLAELLPGSTFHLNGRTFVKETTRRTRALCQEVKTKRKYTVSEAAWVERA